MMKSGLYIFLTLIGILLFSLGVLRKWKTLFYIVIILVILSIAGFCLILYLISEGFKGYGV